MLTEAEYFVGVC